MKNESFIRENTENVVIKRIFVSTDIKSVATEIEFVSAEFYFVSIKIIPLSAK